MQLNIGIGKKKSYFWIPLLFAPLCYTVSPLLYTFTKNKIYFSSIDLLLSVLLFSGAVLILFGATYLIVTRMFIKSRNQERMELVSFCLSIVILLFYVLYTPVKEWLFSLIGTGFPLAGMDVPILIIGVDKILFPLYAGILAATYLLLKKKPYFIPKVNLFFRASGMIVLTISTVQALSTLHNPSGIYKNTRTSTVVDSKSPNIYYIILDTYARCDVLEKYDGYDNSKFMDFLRSKGFYIADKSICNYPITILSLRASLGMDYFPVNSKIGKNDQEFQQFTIREIQLSNVATCLIEHGYTYIPIGQCFFDVVKFPNTQNIVKPRGYFKTGKLWLLQIELTPLEFVVHFFPVQDGALRKNFFLEFGQLDKAIDFNGRKFVFAHIVGPHPPFIIRADGSPTKDIAYKRTITNKKQHVEQRRRKYIEQLQFTTKKTEAVIDKILKTDSSAIVILQSDHGEWNVDTLPENHDYISDTSFFSQRMPILNAYHVPPHINEMLYDSISPVNSFRIILDKLGFKKASLLPDRYFVVWWAAKKGVKKLENQ